MDTITASAVVFSTRAASGLRQSRPPEVRQVAWGLRPLLSL